MLDAVRAEALKLRRHRATWTMVWLYPVVITLLVAGTLLYHLFTPAAAEAPTTVAEWISGSVLLWNVPMIPPGRFLIAGFAAVVFAGEYGWNTWKLIIPARARWQLIAAKWVVAIGFVFLALLLADLTGLLGEWLRTFQGASIPQDVTIGAVADAHLAAAANALLPIVYTVAFAALFAVLTQSILATVILSIALVVIEGLLPYIAIFFFSYAPALVAALVKVLPLYHMANFIAWTRGAAATVPLAPDAVIAMARATSLWALIGWIIAAGAVTQLRFGRQDLN